MATGKLFRTVASLAAITQLAACNAPSRPRVISSAGVPKSVMDDSVKFQTSLYERFVSAAKEAYPASSSATVDVAAQRHFMHTGFALIYSTCNTYIESKSDRQRDINTWRDAFAPITALASGLVGLLDKNGSVDKDYLIGLGLLTSAGNSGFDIYEQRFLFGAKNVNSVRRLVLESLLFHANEVMTSKDMPISYEQSVLNLTNNQMICSPANILELVSDAIDKGKIEKVPERTGNGASSTDTNGSGNKANGVSGDGSAETKTDATDINPPTLKSIQVRVAEPN